LWPFDWGFRVVDDLVEMEVVEGGEVRECVVGVVVDA